MAQVQYPFPGNQTEEQTPAPVVETQEVEQEVQAPIEQETPEPEAEQPEAPVETPGQPEAEAAPEQPEPEIDENKLLESLKKRGFKGNSLDELLKPKEPEAPIKKTYDDETQKFIDFQERTGRGLKEYEQANKDLTTLNPIELAKDRIRRENAGVDLSPEEINYLLEEELGFDPSEEGLEPRELAKFKKFYGSHLNTLKTEQQKLNEAVEGFEPQAEESAQPVGEKIKLSNGLEVDAESYNRDRQKYLQDRDAQLQTLAEEGFKLSYDGKDGKKELDFNYKYTEEDLQSMRSITEDVGGIISDYQNEAGEFNHGDFNKDLWWSKPANRSKAIAALLGKARNEVISEITGRRKNVNFDSPNPLPQASKAKGYTEPGESNSNSAFGVKYGLPTS